MKGLIVPNYDFKCETCNSVVELQDPTALRCGTCGNTMVRIWTSPGIQFKGSGFYTTDKGR